MLPNDPSLWTGVLFVQKGMFETIEITLPTLTVTTTTIKARTHPPFYASGYASHPHFQIYHRSLRSPLTYSTLSFLH